MDKNKLIEALRCSATAGSNCSGPGCAYYTEERLPADLAEIAGTDVWGSCDCDRMALDAASLLEAMEKN